MNNYNIEKKDLEQIEALLRNNKNIERLYNKLYTLELEGKKNTEEYTKLLDYLSIVIEVEDNIYKKANLSLEKTLSWLKFLKQIKNPNNTIVMRINNHLFSSILHNYNNIINISNIEIPNLLLMSGIKLISKDIDKENICKCIIIKETIQKDILYIFTSYLQNVIEDPRQQIFKENILKTKYQIIFLYKDIETFAIKNNLNLPTNPFIAVNLVQEILHIDPNLVKETKESLCSKIALNEIYELLEINDSDYSDIYKSSQAIKRENMIKAVLNLISDEKISDINYTFHEYIEDKEYTLVHPNSNVSENIIINSFKNIKKNKIKIQVLSSK